MTFSCEEDLESVIFQSASIIHEKGFVTMYENTIRQLVLPSTKRIDLFTYEIIDNVLFCKIIELKKVFVGLDTLTQVIGYWNELKSITNKKFSGCFIDIIIVGAMMPHPLLRICSLLNPLISLYEYNLDINGVTFNKVAFKGESSEKRDCADEFWG